MLFKKMSFKKRLVLGVALIVAGQVVKRVSEKQLDKELLRIQLNMMTNHEQRK